jgi:hypothetical protein
VKKFLAFLITAALFLVPLNAVAAVKAGDTCKKVGTTSTVNGKKYTCIKSGKKLVWNKGVTVALPKPKPTPTPTSTPTPTPTQTPTPIPTIADNFSQFATDISACKLNETRNLTGGSKGFPLRSTLSSLGKMKIAIIPVDFANATGSGNPGEMYADDLVLVKEWADYFGRGKMQYDVQLVSQDWIRAPRGAEWYVCVECQKGAKSEKQSQAAGVQEIINLVDGKYDFSGVQFIYFVFPYEAEASFGTSLILRGTTFTTKAGSQIISTYGELAGSVMKADRTKIWDHLIHEVLHYQGLIGHGPINGSDLNIMTNQWGASKVVTSWESFIAGWFGKNEVVCIDKNSISDSIYITMSPIDNYGPEPQSVMIKLSEEEILIIEKRSSGKYSNFTESRQYRNLNSFTAYIVNVNKENYRNDMDPNSEEKNFWRYIRQNDNIAITSGVAYQGLTISPQSNNQIKITKTS